MRAGVAERLAIGMMRGRNLKLSREEAECHFRSQGRHCGPGPEPVQSEQVDFGVMGGTVKSADVETVFEAQDRLHVVYPQSHRIARLKTITPLALSEFPLILMQRETSVRAIVDAGFTRRALCPRVTCEAI
jgi:LysR substrate binding domain